MDNNQYIEFKVNEISFGALALDVRNLYSQEFKINKFNKHPVYFGVTTINNEIVKIIDFKQRIDMESSRCKNERLNLLTFNVNGELIGIIVDDILGVQEVENYNLNTNKSELLNREEKNLNSLFPHSAILDNNEILYLMNTEYINRVA